MGYVLAGYLLTAAFWAGYVGWLCAVERRGRS
jgi:hypothetical protein